MESVFGVTPNVVLDRIKEGVPPPAALVLTKRSYASLSAEDKLFMGWEHQCAQAALPLTDEDLLRGPWLSEPRQSLFIGEQYPVSGCSRSSWERIEREGCWNARILRPGEQLVVERLFEHRKDPRSTMKCWLNAVGDQFDLWMPPVRGEKAAHARNVVGVCFVGFGFDSRMKHFVPEASDSFYAQEQLKVLIPNHKYGDQAYFDSRFALLEFVAQVRKSVRERLVIFDMDLARDRYRAKQQAISEQQQKNMEYADRKYRHAAFDPVI